MVAGIALIVLVLRMPLAPATPTLVQPRRGRPRPYPGVAHRRGAMAEKEPQDVS
jgi:hypothetical protein